MVTLVKGAFEFCSLRPTKLFDAPENIRTENLTFLTQIKTFYADTKIK